MAFRGGRIRFQEAIMGFEWLAPNTTFCADTPQNQRDFQLLCQRLDQPRVKTNLQTQLLSENKRLRLLRAFIPGHEPDR